MKYIIGFIVISWVIIWYFHTHPNAPQQTRDAVATAQATGAAAVDAVTTTSFSGVAKDAQVYYLKNRNYGTSATKNICVDVTSNQGFGDIITAIKKVNNVVTCTADSDYPSKSFTITVPSLLKKGQYYCTDQNAFIGLVPSISKGPFAIGSKCQ